MVRSVGDAACWERSPATTVLRMSQPGESRGNRLAVGESERCLPRVALPFSYVGWLIILVTGRMLVTEKTPDAV
jgi:hypothetical protein